jgi:hypothetical protein
MATLPPRPPAAKPSYRHEVSLGDLPRPGVSQPPEGPVGLHLRLHVAAEPSRGRRELVRRELVRVRRTAATRVCVHARPYVLCPDYWLTIALTTADPGPGT